MQNFSPSRTYAKIMCCECGIPMEPNAANMCTNCIQNRVDISEGIPKQMTVSFCRNCERYLNPPAQWLLCQLESKELLALLLRKVRGLNKVRLVDAGFIWTEPHSRRIKMKLTIQKEAFAGVILQQVFVIETTVCNQQCNDCAKFMAKNTWKAVVQVRQKVDHKRTFLYLEQLILKHNAHKDCINIKSKKDGLDFFFSGRNTAISFLHFLQSVVPIKYKTSEQLISEDIHSGKANYKFTFSVEIVPISKDDLICLPAKAANYLSQMSPICMCLKIGNILHFIDPQTLKTSEMTADIYWQKPFYSLCSTKDLVPFYILEVDVSSHGRYSLADIIVAKQSDFGRNSITYHTRSHLGNILKAGDIALGYDLSTGNYNDENFDQLKEYPDVVLVKKSYQGKTRSKRRVWRMKELVKEEEVLKKGDLDKSEMDREIFMQEIEEDAELRSTVNLYRDSEAIQQRGPDDIPEISLEELLDDLQI